MIQQKEKDLLDALSNLKLTTLPRLWNPEKSKRVWVDAIAEVRKIDGTTNYAYVYNRYGASPVYKKIWGTAAMVTNILNYYPIHYLDKEFIKKFKDVDEMREFVKNSYELSDETAAGMSEELLYSVVYTHAIESQIKFINQRGKDDYKQKQIIENEKIFNEITEGSNK